MEEDLKEKKIFQEKYKINEHFELFSYKLINIIYFYLTLKKYEFNLLYYAIRKNKKFNKFLLFN